MLQVVPSAGIVGLVHRIQPCDYWPGNRGPHEVVLTNIVLCENTDTTIIVTLLVPKAMDLNLIMLSRDAQLTCNNFSG